MLETQENKVNKIASQVKPTTPEANADINIPVIQPSQSNIPLVGGANSTEISLEIGPEKQKSEILDDWGVPIKTDSWGVPVDKGMDDWGIPVKEQENGIVNKLRALRDVMDSTDGPIDLVVKKITDWNIPDFTVDDLVERATRVASNSVQTPEQISQRTDIGVAHKALDITSIPADALISGLREMVHETQTKIGWDEAKTKSVGVNFALNIAREMPDVAAQFIGSTIDPVVLATMGYGKGVSTIAKSTYGKKILIPAIDATVDYVSGKIPSWMARPFTYKFGLPMKQEYLDIAGERIRNIKNWFDTAMETGVKLHDGISVEGQKLAYRLMTKEATEKDIQMLATARPEEWAKFGIKDTQKFFDDLTQARKLVDDSSEVFLEEGIKSKFLTQKTADIIRSNKNKYLPRLYEIFENPNILQQIKSGKASMHSALGLIEDDKSFLRRVAGYTDDQLKAFDSLGRKQQIKMLNKMGKKKLQTQGPFKKPISGWFSSLLKRGDLDIVRRKAMKQIETAAYPTSKTITEMRTATENLRYFQKLSENPEWAMKPKGVIPGDFVGMPVDKKFGALSGKWVHREIASDILSINKMTKTGNFLWDATTKGIMLTNRAWKANKVLFSVATHARNIISNAILLDLSGIQMYEIPELLTSAAKEIKNKGKYYNIAVKHDLIGHSFSATELGDFLPSVEQFKTKDTVSHIQRGVRGLYASAGTVYRKEEEWFKIAKLMHSIRNGASELEAAEEGAKWLFDYTKVNPITEFARTNPIWNIPFFTFTAKSAPRIAEATIKKPFKVYKYHLLFDFMSRASADSLGITQDELDYIKEKKGSFGFLAPTRDDNGDPMWVSMKSMIPWGVIEEDFGKSKIPTALAPGGVTALAMDMAYNQNRQTGQPISKDRPDRNAAMTGYFYKWFAPQTNPIPLPLPGIERRNIRTVGPTIQKLADSAYGSGHLPEVLAKRLLAKKSGYYGASKGVDFAILDAILGLKVEPIQEWVLQKSDAIELKQGLMDAKKIFKSVARDQGISGESGEMQLMQAEQMMNEKFNDVLEQYEEVQGKKPK